MEVGRVMAPRLYRPLGIIHRRRKWFNRATQQFLSLLQEIPHGSEPE